MVGWESLRQQGDGGLPASVELRSEPIRFCGGGKMLRPFPTWAPELGPGENRLRRIELRAHGEIAGSGESTTALRGHLASCRPACEHVPARRRRQSARGSSARPCGRQNLPAVCCLDRPTANPKAPSPGKNQAHRERSSSKVSGLVHSASRNTPRISRTDESPRGTRARKREARIADTKLCSAFSCASLGRVQRVCTIASRIAFTIYSWMRFSKPCGIVAGERPRAQESLVQKIFFVAVRNHLSVDLRFVRGVPFRPTFQASFPLIRNLGKHIDAGAHIFAALGIVRSAGVHGMRPVLLPGLQKIPEVLLGACRGYLRIAANFIQRQQRVVHIQRGVFDSFGHDRDQSVAANAARMPGALRAAPQKRAGDSRAAARRAESQSCRIKVRLAFASLRQRAGR